MDPDANTSSEEDPTVQARALFARGLACVEEHETACAEQSFRRALALRDSPAIRYNLASALFDLGRYPEAARLTASVLADETTPAEIRAHAETLDEQLQSQAGTLRIRLEGSTDGATVQVDGETIPEPQQAAVRVAPGSRTVTAVRGGTMVGSEQAQVERGAEVEVVLTIAPTAEELAASADPHETPNGDPGLVEDWRFWAAVGGGAAVVVAVIVIVAVAAGGGGVEAAIEGNYMPGVLRW